MYDEYHGYSLVATAECLDDGLLSMPDATSATKELTEAKRICQQGKVKPAQDSF